MTIDIDFKQMETELIRDEGVRYSAYQDSLGLWTIGVGRLIDAQRGGRLSQDEVELLLRHDIENCISDVETEPWYRACKTDHQRRAIVNMRFQLGSRGVRTFKTSLSLIAAGKFREAGASLRKSLWYKQTPERAERVIRMIEGRDV